MNIQVSNNFWSDEFTWSSTAQIRVIPTRTQLWMLRNLVRNILQPGRDKFGKFTINSGIRDKRIFDALHVANYNPSFRTDHSYGDHLVYPFGVGAADFVPEQADLWDVFRWYIQQDKEGKITLGQVIIYEDKGMIHIANPKTLVYTPSFVRLIGVKEKYLVNRNKQFHVYSG